MIEKDVYNHLIADVTLEALLVSVTGNNKIYPIVSPQEQTLPYMVYSVAYGDMEEYLHTARLTFKIIAVDYETCALIRNRLKVILDLQDSISITSTDFIIKHSKLISGYDMQDSVDDSCVIIQVYEIRYLEY